MSVEHKLKEMGFEIRPFDVIDNGKFVQSVRTGDLIYTSGQIPSWGDEAIKGKVGGELSIEHGYKAARLCTLNNLRAIRNVIASLDEITQIIKVLGMVNVAPGFNDTPSVINGCSDLLRTVFAEKGHHARSAVGMTIPYDWAVEVEMVVRVRS